jgi:hypothetical protein
VTSVFQAQSTVWIHDKTGQRQLSLEGSAFSPRFSADEKRVYYLLRQNPTTSFTELRAIDLATGRSDRRLLDMSVEDFDVSRDEREIAYTTVASDGKSEIWLAPLDHHESAHLVARDGDQVSFGPNDELIFRDLDGARNFLTRVRKDGTGRARVTDVPILGKGMISPDRTWVLAGSPDAAGHGSALMTAIPLGQGEPRLICKLFCRPFWSPDGRFLYVDTAPGAPPGRTLQYPIAQGQSLPDMPADMPLDDLDRALNLGVPLIKRTQFTPSRDPMMYVFVMRELRGNLFQIPLH